MSVDFEDVPIPVMVDDTPAESVPDTAPDTGKAETKSKRTVKREVKRTPVANRKGQFVKPLTEVYALIGVVGMGAGMNPHVAETVMTQAEACATAWDNLAYQNENVRRMLKGFVETSAWGAVLAAHAPIAIAVISSARNVEPVEDESDSE